MTLRRPVAQGRKRQALGPGFSIDRINPSGLDQHVSFSIYGSRKSFSWVSVVGMAWACSGRTAITQANRTKRSIGFERENEGSVGDNHRSADLDSVVHLNYVAVQHADLAKADGGP